MTPLTPSERERIHRDPGRWLLSKRPEAATEARALLVARATCGDMDAHIELAYVEGWPMVGDLWHRYGGRKR